MSIASAEELLQIPQIDGSIQRGFMWLANDILAHEPEAWDAVDFTLMKTWEPSEPRAFDTQLGLRLTFAKLGCHGMIASAFFRVKGADETELQVMPMATEAATQDSLEVYVFELFASSYVRHRHELCIPAPPAVTPLRTRVVDYMPKKHFKSSL